MSSRPFSLIEVLLVMAIVGLFTFSFFSLERFRSKEKQNRERSKLELKRELAIYKEEARSYNNDIHPTYPDEQASLLSN